MNRDVVARARLCLLVGLGVVAAGCASKPDYSGLEEYYKKEPKTVLILPARNMTTDAEAAQFLMATVSTPLIDRGYYVIPPHLLALALAHEGIDLTGESWEVTPRLLHDHFGADAILYITITEWDTRYVVLKTEVTVGMTYKLVDARTGTVLWTRVSRRVVRSGSSGGGGGIGGLIAKLVVDSIDAALTAATTRYITLAADANRFAFAALPVGSYHGKYEEIQEKIAKWREEQADRKDDEQGE